MMASSCGQRLLVGKHKPAKLGAVDLSILVQDPCAECIQDRLIAGRALGDDAMRKRVRIDGVGAQMLQHAAYNAFAGGDIASQTIDIFPGPVAHADSSVKKDDYRVYFTACLVNR